MDATIALVRRYQSYDPATGQFNVQRTAEQYAELLGPGVHESQLSRFFHGKYLRPWAIIDAFLRTFPHAASEVVAARLADTQHAPAEVA